MRCPEALPLLALATLFTAACTEPEPIVPVEAGEHLFDPTVLHEISIEMDDWPTLLANFESNTYYHADVVIDGHALPGIGVRSRGNGTRSGVKPGLKLDFNEQHPDRRFGLLKNVHLDNFYADPSCLREHLSFQVFDAMGMWAPRTSYARVTVNGTFVALYGVVEGVDKPFFRARDVEEDGNLFDFEVMAEPYDLGPRSSYVPVPFQPKTHEDAPDASALTAFLDAVSAAPDEGYADTISTWIDPAHVLTYYAAEVATVQTDGFTGFLGANNFFLYQPDPQSRFVLVPWDRDYSFSKPDHPIFFRSETNVLVRRLLEDPALHDAYEASLLGAVESHVNEGWLIPRLEAARELIRPAVLEDVHKVGTDQGLDASNALFDSEVETVRASILGRAADVMTQLPAP